MDFQVQGKTYNTKKIIGDLLKSITENYKKLKSIKIRYSEIGSLTTDSKDLIMSGKGFNGTAIEHKKWNKFSKEQDKDGKYNNEILNYFYTKPLANKSPYIKKSIMSQINALLAVNFNDQEQATKAQKDIRSLFIELENDDSKFDSLYEKSICILISNNDKRVSPTRITLFFEHELHAVYWCERFFAIEKGEGETSLSIMKLMVNGMIDSINLINIIVTA